MLVGSVRCSGKSVSRSKTATMHYSFYSAMQENRYDRFAGFFDESIELSVQLEWMRKRLLDPRACNQMYIMTHQGMCDHLGSASGDSPLMPSRDYP